MARIETSTNLVNKTIILLNGTKTKITGAIASGYQTKAGGKRIATRCVVKEGSHFREIERMDMRLLEDTGEGYVRLKDAKATKKAAAPKASSAKTTGKTAKAETKPAKAVRTAKSEEPATSKVRRKHDKSEKDQNDYLNLANAIIKGGKAVDAVEIAEVDGDLTDVIAKRLVAAVEQSNIAKVCADNKTPIANALTVTYGGEFAEHDNIIQITLNLQYAKPQILDVESSATVATLDANLQARANKLAAKKVGKALAKAIKEAFDLDDANELLQGTILHTTDGEDFIFIGESAKHAGKALMFNTDTQSFKSFAAAKLAEFEIVMSESESEEADEEEEEEDIDEEEAEDADEPEEDGDEYEYVEVTKEHLALVNKKVTRKYHAALAEQFGVSVEALAPGLVLTDGSTTFAYLGNDSKGGLLVIDVDAKEDEEDVLLYSKADIKTLVDFQPTVGEATDAGEDNEDEDGEDGEDSDADEDNEDEDGEDGEDGEDENSDEDFDFEDGDDDIDDLSEDELRDRVVELGLTTERKAGNMKADKLRSLLKDA